MKHHVHYYLVLISLLLAGCKGEVCKDLDVLEATATLTWNGDYALDGCGYSVQIGETKYKPDNESDIDESFKSKEIFKGTPVQLKYIPRGRKKDVGCGMLPSTTSIDYILIVSVEEI